MNQNEAMRVYRQLDRLCPTSEWRVTRLGSRCCQGVYVIFIYRRPPRM
jgi:hypothetical protein